MEEGIKYLSYIAKDDIVSYNGDGCLIHISVSELNSLKFSLSEIA